MGIWEYLTSGYQGGGGIIPEDGSDYEPEIKIEQQNGQPTKRTTILRPTKGLIRGMGKGETQPDLAAEGQAFNPMELWAKVSKVVDAEMMTDEEAAQKAQQLQAMGERTRNPGESAIDTPEMLPQGGWPDVQQDTGVPTAPPMSPQGALPHIMDNVPPQGMPPGQPPGDPTAGMPYPPSVFPTSDAPGNPHEMGGRPPFNQGTPQQLMEYPQVPVPQGAPPGQPPVDPTAGQGAMSPVVPQDEGFPEGAVDPRTQADLPALGQNFNAQFTPEETDQRIQSGENDQNRKKTEAAISTAAAMEPLSNDAGGQDASTDPMMWKVWNQLSENPAARKADYLRRMNMLILGGIMLDAMASAMGVESEAGRYIDAQLKMMEAEQKFDDQSRIYELGRSIYYNEEGVYSPPGSQKEAFDRLMQSGATIQEASAMSSKHPEAKAAKGYKEYWKIEANPDGIHENIFLATGQIPPPGYTGKSPNNAIGTVNEGQDIRNLGEIRRLKAAAAELFAAGDIPGANRLNEEAQLLTNMTGGNKGTPAGWHTIWSATHGSMAKQAATDGRPYPHNTYRRPGNDASYIPWPIFQQEWLESESMTVKDGSGKDITIPGYRGLVALGKTGLTQSAPQMNASELNMDTMRANLAARIESYPPGSTQINIDITSFIKAFGVQELQIKYGGEFE